MKKKTFLAMGIICGFCTNAAPVNLIDAIRQNKIQASFTGNSSANNPNGSSHTGKCLMLKLKNTSDSRIDIKVEAAYQLKNQTDRNQDLMTTENMIVSISSNETKTVSVNALCTEKTNVSPSEKDTFILIKKNDATFFNLTAIFEKYKCFLNTAQQALWCFTDNNPIDNIYDTHQDTLVENALVAYVSNAKGVPVPARSRHYSHAERPRIIRYPLEVDSTISMYIDRVTTIGIYITDTNHHPIITLMDDDTEKRTGTAKYSFFYRGQQPKGRYYVEMKKNGEWVRLKEIIIGGE